MKEKHVLIAAAFLLGLATYYLLFERGASLQKSGGEGNHPIFFLEPRDVKMLMVVTADGKELACAQTGEGWEVTRGEKPAHWDEKINDFIQGLTTTVELDRFLVNNSQLSAYGLDNPRFQITLTDVTDKTYLLLVGDNTPVRTSLYVKFADSPQVMIVGTLLTWELCKISGLFLPR